MRWILRPLSLDLRGLAALRILMGVLVMLDALVRSSDLVAHYADSGVLPRSVLLTELAIPIISLCCFSVDNRCGLDCAC